MYYFTYTWNLFDVHVHYTGTMNNYLPFSQPFITHQCLSEHSNIHVADDFCPKLDQ